jgi:hypothetical protein
MWFPMQQPGSNTSSANTTSSSSSSSSGALPVRYLLLPNGSSGSNTTSLAVDGSFLVQPISAAQAIVYVSQRPRSDNINQQQDYSFLNTTALGPANASSSSSRNSNASSPVIIRHAVQANPQMPAFIDNKLAWGSPPTSRQVSRVSCALPERHELLYTAWTADVQMAQSTLA